METASGVGFGRCGFCVYHRPRAGIIVSSVWHGGCVSPCGHGSVANARSAACAIAVAVIVIDELLRVRGRRLPALAVGLGIYLPPSLILPTVTGGITRYFIHRKNKRAMTAAETDDVQESEQCGMLTACGLVAGAALMGVFLAIPFVMMGGPDALSIMPSSLSSVAHALGLLSFLGLIYWMYHIRSEERR